MNKFTNKYIYKRTNIDAINLRIDKFINKGKRK